MMKKAKGTRSKKLKGKDQKKLKGQDQKAKETSYRDKIKS